MKTLVTIAGETYPAGKTAGAEHFELGFTAAKSTPMTKLRIKEWRGKDTPAVWHTALVFGGQAERVCDSLRPGDRIVVTGEWKSGEWTKPDGTTILDKTLFVDDVAVSLRWNNVTVERIDRDAPTPKPVKAAKEYPDEAPF